jgi:hypothetical protein
MTMYNNKIAVNNHIKTRESKDNLLEISTKDFIANIFAKQTEHKSSQDLTNLVNLFYNLYNISFFKDGLDLILTKLSVAKLNFAIIEKKDWDTNVGCFLTSKNTFFHKALNLFTHHTTEKIIIRKLSANVLAHEMAHALEFASKKPLTATFQNTIRQDLAGADTAIITLKTEINRLINSDLKLYKPEQYPSELFARYFELLSLSRNVCFNGNFTTEQVIQLFPQTTNFLVNYFNPLIANQINSEIAYETSKIKTQTNQSNRNSEPNFTSTINSQKQEIRNKGWARTISSNHIWQESWEKIKDNKN